MFGLNAHAVTAPLCPRNVRSSVGSSEWNASFAIGTPPKRTIVADGVWSRASRARVCAASGDPPRTRAPARFSNRSFERALARLVELAHNLMDTNSRARRLARCDLTRRRNGDAARDPPTSSRSAPFASSPPRLSLSASTFPRGRLARTASAATRRPRVVDLAGGRVPSSPPLVSLASPRPTSPTASRTRRDPTCVPNFFRRPTVPQLRPTRRTASRWRARRRRRTTRRIRPSARPGRGRARRGNRRRRRDAPSPPRHLRRTRK